MKAESSLTILENFLKEQKIDLKPKKILKDYLVESEDLKSLPVNIVSQIIVDAYDEASEKVKKIDQILVSKHKIHLGRVQKDQLKKCLDYRNDEDVIELVSLTRDETGKFEKAIRKILKSNQLEEKGIRDTMKKFHDNLTKMF